MSWWGLWWGAAVAEVWESLGLSTHLEDLPTRSGLHEFAPAALFLLLDLVLLILCHWSVLLLLLLVDRPGRGLEPSQKTGYCFDGAVCCLDRHEIIQEIYDVQPMI
jgi:hypothetical protein